jgi:hypothetical protein
VNGHTPTTNPAPNPIAFCAVTTDSGPVTVICEPVNDTIVITPTFGMDENGNTHLRGDFVVTHRPTGRHLSDGSGCINCCRSAAHALIATGIDWAAVTADTLDAVVASWTIEQKTRVAAARTVAWSCDAEVCEPWKPSGDTLPTEGGTQ